MARTHFHIALPKPSTGAQHLPHPHYSSTASSTKIPEYILEAEEPVEIHRRTAEEIAADQAEWEAIARARVAARRMVTIDLTSERMSGETKMESVVMIDRVDTAVSEALSGSEGMVSPSRD